MPKAVIASNNSAGDVTSLLIQYRVGIRSRVLLWVICIFVVLALLWAASAEIDELVRGEGKVIPSKQLQIIQNLEGGILSELYVEEGQQVALGQILLKIDDTQFASSFEESQLSINTLQARIDRLRAEVGGARTPHFSVSLEETSPAIIREQTELFERRFAQLTSADKVINQQIKQKRQVLAQAKFDYQQAKNEQALAQKELSILKPLFEEGVVSEVELLRAEKSVLNASGKASSAQFKIPQIEAGIDELQDKREQLTLNFKSEAQQALSDSLAALAQLSQSSGALEDRVERTSVRSPVSGTVKQIMLNTLGGVVRSGMDLVSIVPNEDSLLIETKVRPADIARLYPGQKAMVKFTAYDFTIYGGLEAELIHISADSINDDQGESFYLVRVKTLKNNLGTKDHPLPIIPGMIAQIDILTGKKVLLNYLLKPILKAKQVALTEP